MKKIITILMLMSLSLNLFAQCEYDYEQAAKRRQERNALIAFGVVLVVPVANSVAISAAALTGAVGYGFLMNGADQNTFGKVRRVLKGETELISKKVAKILKKTGVIVNKDDSEFVSELRSIVDLLLHSGRACMSLGFNDKFEDEIVVYNLRKISQLVADEYLIRSGAK